ncbi:MAG: ABC transporter permease [Gemmatimonadota bacterium]
MADLKLALRTLSKTPFVTLVAILSLALGIGANAAIYSMFDEMLIQPLPVQNPDELVNLANPGPKPGSQSCGQAGGCDEVFSYPMFRDLEAADAGFSGLAAHVNFGANLALSDRTTDGQGLLVSGSYFPVLGVTPALGRLLGPEDDRTIGGHPVAVLSFGFWRRQLGSDPGVLNRVITVNGQPLTVVGVASRAFTGTTLGNLPDVFVPLTMRSQMVRGWEGFENRRTYFLYLFGRLQPGLTAEQAEGRVNTVYSGLLADVEAPLQTGMSEETMTAFLAKRVTVKPGQRGQSSLHADVKVPLIMLLTITGLVLLIACANIANLLLARGAGRGQEMAIRGSLGGSRKQLLRPLIVESLTLAVLGGVASLLIARWTLVFIGSALPPQAAGMMSLTLRPQVVIFTAAISIGTGFLFGLYPALHSTRPDLVTMLKSVTGQASGSRSAARFRSSLVTAQVALSMALLVAAGLFIKSLTNVSRIDLGLVPDNIVQFTVSPVRNGYEAERSRVLFGRIEEELGALPGVTSVSAARVAVIGGSSWGTDVRVQGFESGPDIDSNSRYNQVGADYFSMLSVPLLAGREFTTADALGGANVAIVNEAFARKFGLDGADAVGKFMRPSFGPPAEELNTEIVGVVKDAKYNDVKDDIPPVFFVPYRQDESIGALTFYARTAGDPEAVQRAIPDVIRRLDANLPVEDLKTLDRQIKENLVTDRLISTLASAFAALATLLAAVGLYGVLAFTVTQRTREIGLRMALGADAGQVRGMVLRQVGRMLVVGAVVGLVLAVLLGKAAASLLFGLSGSDPFVIGAVAAVMTAVAFTAGYLPAARASKVDPMVALRYE